MKKNKILLDNKFSLLFFVFILLNSCSSVDKAIEYALNFEGIFENSSGYQIKLEEEGSGSIGKATYIKLGNLPLDSFFHASVGDHPITNAIRTSENTWDGIVAEKNGVGFVTGGVISIDGDILNVKPNNNSSYSFVRVSSASGGAPVGGGTPGTSQVLVNQCISGQVGDKKIIRFNVPDNAKTMVIQTSEVVGVCDRNTADLFIRKGSDPTVTKTPTYSWVADCASIQPNRQDETCSFVNPSSGQWSVMLFGYNIYFISSLKVTVTY